MSWYRPAGSLAAQGADVLITPQVAAWEYSGLRVYSLDGSPITLTLIEEEAVIVPLSARSVVVELDGTGLRAGLEVKPPEMWAGFTCDHPFEQWSFGNEAHGVLLDEPDEAFGRAYGELVPVTFDVEWYASAAPEQISGGYEQLGEVDTEIELREGIFRFAGPGRRVHVWGNSFVPSAPTSPTGWGLRAPYRRRDGSGVEQVLTRSGWSGWVRPG